jgi:hypothetical protein
MTLVKLILVLRHRIAPRNMRLLYGSEPLLRARGLLARTQPKLCEVRPCRVNWFKVFASTHQMPPFITSAGASILQTVFARTRVRDNASP